METASDSSALILMVLMAFLLDIIFIGRSARYFSSRINSEKVPMQWGIDGNPIWFAPRLFGIWWQLYFTLIVGGGLFVMSLCVAKEKIPALCVAIVLVSVVGAATQVFHMKAVVRWERENNGFGPK
jgi:hypothetical protein